jgi:hypothetical protein
MMTKEEREKYRQEINSRKLYIGTKELIERTLLLGFLEHIDALERQIKEAHKEGYFDAIDFIRLNPNAGMADHSMAWEGSAAKAAIASAPEVKNE